MSALQDTDEPQDGPDDCATLIERLEKIVKDTLQTFISKCIEKKEQYAIIRLKTNKEGVEKGSHGAIKEYYTFLSREIREFGIKIPRAASWRIVFSNIDRWYEHRVSNVNSKIAQHTWADYESKKAHFLLTYTRRQCVRSWHGISRSLHVNALKRILVEEWQVEFPAKICSDSSVPEVSDLDLDHDDAAECISVSSGEFHDTASSAAMAGADETSDYEPMSCSENEHVDEKESPKASLGTDQDMLKLLDDEADDPDLAEEEQDLEQLPDGIEVIDSTDDEGEAVKETSFSNEPESSPGAGLQPTPDFVASVLKQTAGVVPNSVQHKADLAVDAKRRRLEREAAKPAGSKSSGKRAKGEKGEKGEKARAKHAEGTYKIMKKTEKTRNGSFWCVVKKLAGTKWSQVVMCTPGQFGDLESAEKACKIFKTMLEEGADIDDVKRAKVPCLT